MFIVAYSGATFGSNKNMEISFFKTVLNKERITYIYNRPLFSCI